MRFMPVPINPGTPPPPDEKQPLIATFKSSLRAWQARYKARLAAQALVSEKGRARTTPI